MAVVDEFFNTIVEGERRQGIPDEQIARDLGISVERLRQLYPPHPRGHVGPNPPERPYVAPPPVEDDPVTRYQRPPDDGGGIAILLLLMLLAS